MDGRDNSVEELIRMKKHKEMIYEIIQDTLDVSKAEITDIVRTPGGETNISYFVTVNGSRYVIRFPGKGTEALIDRQAEKLNVQIATELGINPAFVYFDEATGIKMTHAIEDAKPLLPPLEKQAYDVNELVSLFQALHHSDKIMYQRYHLSEMIHYYERLAFEENRVKMEGIMPLRAEIHALLHVYESFYFQEAPCHMDAVCINILKDKQEQLCLIDWEYSGMFDPLWDLATLFLSLEMTEEEEALFLTNYFNREAHLVERQRLHLLKIFLDYYWGLWYFFKEAKGEDYGSKGTDRRLRATASIALYKQLFTKDVVV